MNINEETIGQLVQALVIRFVEFPADVRVEEGTDHFGKYVKLFTNKKDISKVVGKKGQTINSIRMIVKCICSRRREKVSIIVVE